MKILLSNNDHNINFDNVSIIAKEENRKRRKIREVIEIKKEKKSINFESNSGELRTFDSHLLDE